MTMGLYMRTKQAIPTNIVAQDGTGTHTDIQQAIDDLPTDGGKVYIKEGTYIISSRIYIKKSNVTIEGAGDGTILKAADNFHDYMIYIGDGINTYYSIFLNNFTIDHNDTGYSGADVAIVIDDYVHTPHITNLYFKNVGGSGIVITSGQEQIIISQCRFVNIFSAAINATAGILFIHDNYFSNCNNTIQLTNVSSANIMNNYFILGEGITGVYCSGSEHYLICNNTFISNNPSTTTYGIYLGGTGKRAVISNNTFKNMGIAIYLSSTSSCEISNNAIYSCTNYGIYLTQSNDNIINGNYIIYAISYDGIYFYSQCTNNIVTGNRITSCKYGIHEKDSTSDYNIITSNNCRGNSTGGILTYGTHDIVANNLT